MVYEALHQMATLKNKQGGFFLVIVEKDVWLKPHVSEVLVSHYPAGSGCSGTFPQTLVREGKKRRPTIVKLHFLLDFFVN